MGQDRLQLTELSRLLRDVPQVPGDRGPLWPLLTGAAARASWQSTDLLRRVHPAVWGLFGSEQDARIAIVDLLDERGPMSGAELLTGLRSAASRSWIVTTPLVNLRPPLEPIGIDETRLLVAASDGDLDHRPHARRFFDVADVRVGDRFRHDADDELADTRHTASLLSARTGSRSSARELATTEARLAVAVWTLLSPPTDDVYMPLWPVVTTWQPQPSQHSEAAVMARDEGRHSSDGITVLYGHDALALYEIPDGAALMAPFRAVELATDRRSARALLSASWHLYRAARLPTDELWLDRLVMTMTAREAICEPAGGSTMRERWRTGCAAVGVPAAMRRAGWSTRDLNAVDGRAWDLRNLGVHSADASLLALGFPADRARPMRRGPELPGAQLSPLAVREAVMPTFAAVRLLVVGLWERMLDCGFDDAPFEELLSSPR